MLQKKKVINIAIQVSLFVGSFKNTAANIADSIGAIATMINVFATFVFELK